MFHLKLNFLKYKKTQNNLYDIYILYKYINYIKYFFIYNFHSSLKRKAK